MYISLNDSRTKGFRKWADTHQPQQDGKAGSDDGSAAVVVPVPDDAVPTEQPHRPWLVPGAGRL